MKANNNKIFSIRWFGVPFRVNPFRVNPHPEPKDKKNKNFTMNTNNNTKFFSKVQLLQFLVAFFVTAFGIITAYYTTIAGIKLDLSKKAESEMVNQLDRRLSNIEILLNQNFLTKEEFHHFSEDLQNRLTKIEYQLSTLKKQ